MTPLEREEAHAMLIAARELIATPSQWIKGVYEDRREDGVQCFCLLGALRQAARVGPPGYVLTHVERARYYRLRGVVLANLPTGSGGYAEIHHFNDDTRRTHAEVLAVLDRCIERTKACG